MPLQIVYLTPKNGLKVLAPETQTFLPPEGQEVELTSYWRRRISEGSVTIGSLPKPEKQTKSTSKKGANHGDQL